MKLNGSSWRIRLLRTSKDSWVKLLLTTSSNALTKWLGKKRNEFSLHSLTNWCVLEGLIYKMLIAAKSLKTSSKMMLLWDNSSTLFQVITSNRIRYRLLKENFLIHLRLWLWIQIKAITKTLLLRKAIKTFIPRKKTRIPKKWILITKALTCSRMIMSLTRSPALKMRASVMIVPTYSREWALLSTFRSGPQEIILKTKFLWKEVPRFHHLEMYILDRTRAKPFKVRQSQNMCLLPTQIRTLTTLSRLWTIHQRWLSKLGSSQWLPKKARNSVQTITKQLQGTQASSTKILTTPFWRTIWTRKP